MAIDAYLDHVIPIAASRDGDRCTGVAITACLDDDQCNASRCHKILGTPLKWGPRVPIFPGKMGTPLLKMGTPTLRTSYAYVEYKVSDERPVTAHSITSIAVNESIKWNKRVPASIVSHRHGERDLGTGTIHLRCHSSIPPRRTLPRRLHQDGQASPPKKSEVFQSKGGGSLLCRRSIK